MGQNPPLAFFFAAYGPTSPFDTALEFELGCIVVDEEEDELVDEIDDDEFVLCTLFL